MHPLPRFLQDKRLKGTVYRIRGSVPACNYLQLPRTGTQSLGLRGRYLYLLFRPLPRKHFVVHLDVATQVREPGPAVPSRTGTPEPAPPGRCRKAGRGLRQ